MNERIVIFKTIAEFDRLMLWAARENLVWISGNHPKDTHRSIRENINNKYLRMFGQCALCINKAYHMGYADVEYFRENAAYSKYTFNTVQEVLQGGDIDCTIPEEKETA